MLSDPIMPSLEMETKKVIRDGHNEVPLSVTCKAEIGNSVNAQVVRNWVHQ